MEWIQFSLFLLTVLGIFISNRTEYREHSKEMKFLHGRICTLEERYIALLEKSLPKKDGRSRPRGE